MKYLLLALLFSSCTGAMNDVPIGIDGKAPNVRKVADWGMNKAYILTVDSVEYIVVRAPDAVAITKHK